MLEIKAKLKIRRSAYKVDVRDRLKLAFAARQAGDAHARLESGEEVALALPKGEVLRGGDLVSASDGRLIEVLAEIEPLLHVECPDAVSLCRLAYHLGSRHVPVEMGEGFLRIARGDGLEKLLKDSGARTRPVEAPFEPEVGTHVHEHAPDGHDHDHHGHDHHHHDHHGHHHHHR